MNRLQLVGRVRSITRDFTGTLFREQDINDFINEAIDRSKQIIQALEGMDYLESHTDSPTHLPSAYHQLLSVYASARCFEQDERFHQSGNLMNEFEAKMEELRLHIETGRVVIKDEVGGTVSAGLSTDHVVDTYFERNGGTGNYDFDRPEDDDEFDGGGF